MSQSMSIGGASAVPSTPAPEPVTKVSVNASAFVNDGIVPVGINSYHDMKLAELKGDNFSISQEHVVKAIEQAIKAVQGKTTELSFTIHSKTKLISVKVLDKESGAVLREIPPEKTLDFVAKLWKMAGIIIDERR
jgi:flagellar protein FlaG